MKLLFDQNISFRIEKKLSAIFNESKHLSSLNLMNVSDIDIWNFAKKESFTIVTFDSDFFDLSLIYGCPPKIIWVRKGNQTTNQLCTLLDEKHLSIRDFISNPEKVTIACLEID